MIYSKSLEFVHFQCFVSAQDIQSWFQSDPNGLSTNVLKMYVNQRTKYVYIWIFLKCLSHAKNFLSLLATCCFR